MDKIEIYEFSDPICTWCWGSEPIIRKLEQAYLDNIKIHYVMGGLVKDITTFYDAVNGIGVDPIKSNKAIGKHWYDASSVHHMPVDGSRFDMFNDEYISSVPQNRAYLASKLEGEDLSKKFLRALREASEVYGRKTNRFEVLIEIASEVGLDVAQFIENYHSYSSDMFKNDVELCNIYNISGFPSFLIKYKDREVVLRGFQKYETINAVIKELTNNRFREIKYIFNHDNVIDFIYEYNRVAPVEVAINFNVQLEEAVKILDELVEEMYLFKLKAGNGFFYEIFKEDIECDENGICFG
ncbi:MAG: DsbA family protein [Bacilli bacterium]